jgi:PilZ domain
MGTIDRPIKSLQAEDLGERSQPHQRATTPRSPSQGPGQMPLDHIVSGRMERRLPIVVVVRLAQAERPTSNGEERTYTDNISPHGARIFSKKPWQLGDEVIVTPVNEESTARGSVVYCHRLDNDHYGLGVQFQNRPVVWSALRRYDGL